MDSNLNESSVVISGTFKKAVLDLENRIEKENIIFKGDFDSIMTNLNKDVFINGKIVFKSAKK